MALLAVAAVLATQLLLAFQVEEDVPECVCPPPKEVMCTEVIELPCGHTEDQAVGLSLAEKTKQLEEAMRRRQGSPPANRQQLQPPLSRDEDQVDEERRSRLQRQSDHMTEEWARRLATTELHKRCSEAPTAGEVLNCLTRSQFDLEDWVAQLKQMEHMPSIGEAARLVEGLTLENALEMDHELEIERIRVTGDDLIYGDPGVEGRFFIETEGYPFGGAVFRVTLEGPEVVNAPIVDHRNGRYSGTYLVATAGLYKVTILYESGRYESVAIPSFGKACDGAVVYQGNLQVTGISFITPRELCENIPMMTNGRHVWAPNEEREGGEELQWQPWECGLHRQWTVAQLQQCVEERELGRILLLGESGTFAIYKALGGDAEASPAYCLFEKELCEYLPLHFATPAINDANTLLPRHMRAWSHLLGGLGPLNTVAMPGRRNILMWNVGVRELIQDQPLSEFTLHADLVTQVISDYWDGDHFYRTPTALHRRCAGEPERYWSLTNERMAEYSSAAEEIVLRGGGHVLDNYNITVAMRRATSDVKSYNRELNHELALLILNTLCIADDWL